MQWHCGVCSGSGWTCSVEGQSAPCWGAQSICRVLQAVYVGSPLFALPFSSHTHDMHLNLSLSMLQSYCCKAMLYELQARTSASVHSIKHNHIACNSHNTAFANVCHDTIVLTQRHNHHCNVYLCISVFDTSDKGMQWHCDVCSGGGWTGSTEG